MTLKTERDTPEMADRILAMAEVHPSSGHHYALAVVYEHGQHWIVCADCGAQWSVNDATGGSSVDGFDLEAVSEGDGCREQ